MYKYYIKRIIDIFLALALLIVFFIPCIIVAIMIKLDSDGPIFADAPKRVGQNGKNFKMFKFRSMIVNAHNIIRTDPKYKELYEQFKNNSFKLNHDPRVTKVGKWIRKYSLDEVPQIINVLLGEMSVIGPRAYYQDELDHQSEKYPEVKSEISKVLSVKPGITGLWQVSGRSEVNFDKRILIDAKYVDELSFESDMKILFKTPLVMISGRGAS
ncbi:MAG: sugar transferase [Patescibacteria group bacterium]